MIGIADKNEDANIRIKNSNTHEELIIFCSL